MNHITNSLVVYLSLIVCYKTAFVSRVYFGETTVSRPTDIKFHLFTGTQMYTSLYDSHFLENLIM